jgi:hypothetical protein
MEVRANTKAELARWIKTAFSLEPASSHHEISIVERAAIRPDGKAPDCASFYRNMGAE